MSHLKIGMHRMKNNDVTTLNSRWHGIGSVLALRIIAWTCSQLN